MTLSSNSSMENYPENTAVCYTTKLADTVELEGDWEVGLAEMSIPGAVYNVVANQCYYSISLDNVHFFTTLVPEGNYERLSHLLAVIHFIMPKDVFNEPHIKFTPKVGHIEMTFAELLQKALFIRFSESLAEILGADADVAYNHNHARTSRKFSLTHGDINSMYIYYDILEHVTVGDTKAPLLRIVDKVWKRRGNVHQTFNPILYVPLQKKNFNRVEVNIMTDDGRPVSFRYGKSFVVLEFRRPYLGL